MAVVKRISRGIVNCFLVTDGDNSVLVDTCTENDYEKISHACKGYNMRAIVLTHGHLDHIENVAILSKEFKVPILMHWADMRLIGNQCARKLYTHTLRGKLLKHFTDRSMRRSIISTFKPTDYIKEGDDLSCFGINAKIICLEGHTKGSVGILIDDETLIVGDAMMNMMGKSGALIYENRDAMEQSCKRIKQLAPKTICYGHGLNTSGWNLFS